MERIRILLTDSNKYELKKMSEFFSPSNYIKHKATTGADCFNKVLTEIIDIAIINKNLKDMDGCELSQLIKDNPKTKHIPIILISENDDNDDILKVYSCGAFDVFTKPLSKSVLVRRVNMLYQITSTKRALEDQIKVLKELNKRNLEMKQQVEKMASIDYLTEIANRRELDKQLSDLYVSALQEKKPLTLLMMDLDNFKMYNDYFGHQKGDRALRDIAKTSKKIIDNYNGLIGRYGGEEFLAVIKDADELSAIDISSKIIKEISDLEIKHSPVSQSDHLTVSIGLVSFVPNNNTSIGQLLSLADEALYDAKNQGKNMYIVKNV